MRAIPTPGRQPGAFYRYLVAILLATLAMSSLWQAAAAQTTSLILRDVNLRLSPEYDDPGMLVIVSGNLDGTVTYPQRITLPLPAGARGLQTTEVDQGQLLTRQASTSQDGQVSYELQSQPGFQTEYYLDREPSGNDRVIRYTWRAPYAIKDLTITVQQPARSTGFSVTPKEDSSFQGTDGLTTYALERSNVQAGDLFDVTIKYTKSDSAPSFSRNPAAASSAAGSGSSGQPETVSAQAPGSAAQAIPVAAYILIGAGVATLVAAAVYWWLERRRDTSPAPVAVRGRATMVRPPRAAVGEDTRYCPKCGRPYRPGDRFCGQCGSPRSA